MPSVMIEPRDEDAAYEDERAREDWEAAEKKVAVDRAYYGLCWPYACKSCGGWGVHSWIEKHDAGPGEHMSDPCPDCTARYGEGPQLCARCSRLGLDTEGSGPCVFCGWNYDDGMPSLS